MARRLSFRPFFGPLRLRPATYWGTPLFCYAETVTCVTGQTSLMEACREVDRAGLRVDDRLGTEAVAEKQSSCIFIAFICVLNLRPFAQPPQKKHFHFRQQSIFFHRKIHTFLSETQAIYRFTEFVCETNLVCWLKQHRFLFRKGPHTRFTSPKDTPFAGSQSRHRNHRHRRRAIFTVLFWQINYFSRRGHFNPERSTEIKKKNIKTNIRTQIY